MPSVSINPPKTPVTKGSDTIATATLPNVCKMPGPPAPFVPTPLPNIGKGGKSPQDGYSTTVKIEGHDVAIKGASFGSMGDIASKALGGGMVSMNCEGPTTFVAPGSLDVKIEGKNVQFLGDQMLNNNGPSGSPANSACMMGALHKISTITDPQAIIACAIQCCDQEPHELPPPKKGKGDGKACQRLSKRKHSCVFHKLKERLKDPKAPKIENSPIYEKGRGKGQIRSLARNRIPDTHIPGAGAPAFPNGHIIDAKFPCEVAQIVAPTGPGYSPPDITVKSLPQKAADMPCNKNKDAKEKKDYLKIAKTVESMSPEDAKAFPCDCK